MIASDSLLKSIIDVSHIEIQLYSFNRKELICTSGLAKEVLGYTEKEFQKLSKNFYEDIVHPDDLPLLLENIDSILTSSEKQIIEMTARYKRASGDYIWVYTRKMVTERNKQGKPCTIISLAENVNDMVILEVQLKDKVHQLQSISWKNSHLLRGPVTSILGLMNMVEQKDITSSHNMQIFNYLRQAVEKLDSVISDINKEANK